MRGSFFDESLYVALLPFDVMVKRVKGRVARESCHTSIPRRRGPEYHKVFGCLPAV